MQQNLNVINVINGFKKVLFLFSSKRESPYKSTSFSLLSYKDSKVILFIRSMRWSEKELPCSS